MDDAGPFVLNSLQGRSDLIDVQYVLRIDGVAIEITRTAFRKPKFDSGAVVVFEAARGDSVSVFTLTGRRGRSGGKEAGRWFKILFEGEPVRVRGVANPPHRPGMKAYPGTGRFQWT